MKRALLLILLTACATQPSTPPAPVAIDPPLRAAIDRVEGLIAKDPQNTPFIYILATYYDRGGDVANVVRWLTRLDELGWTLGLGPDSFEKTSNAPEFKRIAARLSAKEPRVNRARTAFTFASLDSEGVAYDPVDDVFYYNGGAGKLLRVDRRGNATDIAIEPLGSKFGRLGMDVDAERRRLWVISSVFSESAPAEETGRSAISVYDLRDFRLLRRVWRGSATEPSQLNDLTLLKDGTAFATDTGRSQVVRLAPDADAFEMWAEDFRGPNGIATSADERTLFVTDFRGINQFDVATKSRRLLKTSTPLNGIDGLVEYHGSLIGIQNVLGRPRVVRVHVNDGNRVELLESKNPLLNVPATGVVAGNEYHFLANLGQKDAQKVILKILLRD